MRQVTLIPRCNQQHAMALSDKRQVGGGKGMSRAAKKRAKKRQKEEKLNGAPASTDKNKERKETLQLFDAKKGDSDSDVDFDPGPPANGEDMEIADVSRGELDYLASKGVAVTTNKSKKARKEAKKRKLAASADDEDSKHEGDSTRVESGDENEEERELRELVQMLAQHLTPAEILTPLAEDAEGDQNLDNPRRMAQGLSSMNRAACVMATLLQPAAITVQEFYRDYWEKKPLLVSRPKVSFSDGNTGAGKASEKDHHAARLAGIFSKADIQDQLEKCSLRYGRELNVTRYADSGDGTGTRRRVTLDLPPKRNKKTGEMEPIVADSKDVWANFGDGCTVRLLSPQLHSDLVQGLLSTLELEFGCMVGANAYLTPGGKSQGFAPHYDDIEAFILQLEGRKRWLVYPPPNKAETLPRFSSSDFTEADIEAVDPVIDTILGPGDVLYMPRGWIHQAHTLKGSTRNDHSLHLTVSAMQKWSWADFLDMILPEALEAAAASETSTAMREGLPRNFLSYTGAMFDADTEGDGAPEGLKETLEIGGEEYKRQRSLKRKQDHFFEEANKRIMRVCKEAMSMVNAGCDQMGKRFLSDRQPPAFTQNEAALTSDNRAENGGRIWPNTLCRLARPGIARLVLEDGKAILYHCADNSRIYQGIPLSPMEFEVDDAPALEMLLTTVEPHWLSVKDLIHGDIEDKMEIAQSLYDEGILAIYQEENPDKSVQTG